jgi:hypothetical protein
MAIPTSKPLSLSTVQAEYGGSNPISMSEYRGKGNAPGSGAIDLWADFNGTSNIPAPIARTFFDRNTGPNAATQGCVGTSAVVRGASTYDNYGGSGMQHSTTDASCYHRIYAADPSFVMRWWNPAFSFRETPSSFNNILGTDRLCRIQFDAYAQYANGDTVGNPSHRTLLKLSSGAGTSTINTRFGSDVGSGLMTFTTTQNLQWYLDNNEYVEFYVYGTEGGPADYFKTDGDGFQAASVSAIRFII